MNAKISTVFAVFQAMTLLCYGKHLRNPITMANKFEGDINGVDKNSPKINAGVAYWPGGVIPFNVDSNIDRQTTVMIYEAINAIKAKTCIKVIAAQSKHESSVYFKHGQPGQGCYTKVGKQKGAQNVVLDVECTGVGTIIHLLMHVIGFWHESARNDRDNHIKIEWTNIPEKDKNNFKKYVVPYDGQTYDFHSITHLPSHAFAKNANLPTMVKKGGASLPDWSGLSAGDAEKINHVYCQGIEPGERLFMRARRSMSDRTWQERKANREKEKKERREKSAADRHHERHGHSHGHTGHGYRGRKD